MGNGSWVDAQGDMDMEKSCVAAEEEEEEEPSFQPTLQVLQVKCDVQDSCEEDGRCVMQILVRNPPGGTSLCWPHETCVRLVSGDGSGCDVGQQWSMNDGVEMGGYVGAVGPGEFALLEFHFANEGRGQSIFSLAVGDEGPLFGPPFGVWKA